MYKLAVLFFVTSSLAKFLKPEYDYLVFEHSNTIADISKPDYERGPVEKAWVLDLNDDVKTVRLRVAPENEVLEVFSGPRFRKRPNQKRVNDEPKGEASSAATERDEKAMLAAIMRAINKFVLSTHTEPDAHLTDSSNDSPSLKLYFKDVHTALVVRLDNKHWNYVIGPPSPFPEWFHEEHAHIGHDSSGDYVDLPKQVKMKFYSALFHLLTTVSSFPV